MQNWAEQITRPGFPDDAVDVFSFTAPNSNNVLDELKNAVTTSGQTLGDPDTVPVDPNVEQVAIAMAIYAAIGTFYDDSGAADAYVLSPRNALKAPPSYQEGQTVRWKALVTNTGGAATIKVAGLGVVSLTDTNGSNLSAGTISIVGENSATYDSGNNRFEVDASTTTGDIPSGTKLPFYQAAAPVGWTKDTTANLDNAAMRIVTGVGGGGAGTVDFTTAFASQAVSGSVSVGSTALSTAQGPSHDHVPTAAIFNANPRWVNIAAGGGTQDTGQDPNLAQGTGAINFTETSGSGVTHTHSGSLSGNAIDLAVRYRDFIIAAKD